MPDNADLIGAAGLLLMVAGLALWSVPVALVVSGCVLMLVAWVVAPRRTR